MLKEDSGKVEKVVGQTAIPSSSKIVDSLSLANPLNAMSEVAGFLVAQIKDIDDTFIKIEDTISSISMTFGGMRNFAQSIRENILDATTGVMSLGGELDDVVNIQKGVIKGLQTQTILTKDSFEGLYASGALLNDGNKATVESTQKLASEFVNAGYSIYDVSKQVTGIVNESRAQGVIVSAVYSQISANMNKLALYDFENGVQGMAKMAAKAASLRIDMKGAFDFAEKLFDPEKAIEISAELQRLGVNSAALTDPFKLMDLRNDPAKLQEEIVKVAEQFSQFNPLTKQMEILPEAQRMIRELAKTFELSKEELAKLSINAGELKIKLREIKFSADFEGDEETKNLIANMAQRKDNKYVVTFDEYNKQTGNIESVTKEVSQLTKDNKAAILKAAEPAQSAVELQRSANLTLTNIALDINAIRGLGARAGLRSPAFATMVGKVGKYAEPRYEAVAETFGINKVRNKDGGINVDVTNFNQGVSKLGNITVKLIEDISKGQINFEGLLKLNETYINNIKEKILNFPEEFEKRLEKKLQEQKQKDVTKSNFTGDKLNNISKSEIASVNPILKSSEKIDNKIINSSYQTNNQSYVTNNQETVKELKSTIYFNLKVDPPDMGAMVMNYINKIDLGKQLSKQLENHYNEYDAIRGNTPSVKINIG
jgi:hypothetical protein